jgi:hypothetical protein
MSWSKCLIGCNTCKFDSLEIVDAKESNAKEARARKNDQHRTQGKGGEQLR